MIWTRIDDEIRATPDGGWCLNVYHTRHGCGWSVDRYSRERAYGRADSEEQGQERAEKMYKAFVEMAEIARTCEARVSV